jgi:nitric oxide reductase large subunit
MLIGLAVSFNIIVIMWKFRRGRTADAFTDASLLALIAVVFSGTFGALVVGTIASAVISIYLFISPPRWSI